MCNSFPVFPSSDLPAFSGMQPSSPPTRLGNAGGGATLFLFHIHMELGLETKP